jgi:hypothetical protein
VSLIRCFAHKVRSIPCVPNSKQKHGRPPVLSLQMTLCPLSTFTRRLLSVKHCLHMVLAHTTRCPEIERMWAWLACMHASIHASIHRSIHAQLHRPLQIPAQSRKNRPKPVSTTLTLLFSHLSRPLFHALTAGKLLTAVSAQLMNNS